MSDQVASTSVLTDESDGSLVGERYSVLGQFSLRMNELFPEPNFGSPVSQVCGYGQFLHADFLQWLRLLQFPFFPHRKYWEWCYVLQCARDSNILRRGSRAIGFGCGNEPVPATLARFGVSVLASDQPRGNSSDAWDNTGQHADSVAQLFMPHVVDRDEFDSLVRFRAIDMLDIPEDLGAADLVWSCCVIEHLGSPSAGLEFIEKSLQLLTPGGIAIHTTELDLVERDFSLDLGNCAIYQSRQLLDFADRVRSLGFEVDMNLHIPMATWEDRFVSPPPYPAMEPHLKLKLGPTVTTSVGLFIRRPGPS